MAARRRTASLLIVLLGLGSTLLSGDAIPQGYQPRYRRDHRCPTCPRDCAEKLSGGTAEIVIEYQTPKPQYAKPPAAQPPYIPPHPTPASYVTSPPQPRYPEPPPQYPAPLPEPRKTQYSAPPPPPPARPYERIPQPAYQPPPPTRYVPQTSPPCGCPDCPPNDDPYEYPGFDCDCGCRYGRSLDDDDYPMFNKYNRRSVDGNDKGFAPRKEYRQEPLPFADESSPPADFYKNYKPYVREQFDRREYGEEQTSGRGSGNERERLFVVYRADAPEDKPSDTELESVIRQAMDVARQQKTQEDFAFNARKAKSPERYRYEHEKYHQDAGERVDFEALKEEDGEGEAARFNLSPGPLMNVDETYVAEEGDDELNPGVDQSRWTVVPSLNDLTLVKPGDSEDIEEIEAAVSVVPEMPKTKLGKVPKIVQKAADASSPKEKVKKETIEVVRADEAEKQSEMVVAEMARDVQTPTIVTEATKFEGPVESPVTSAPTTNASAA